MRTPYLAARQGNSGCTVALSLLLMYHFSSSQGFSENHYFIEGQQYHAYELTYRIPSPDGCALSLVAEYKLFAII